MRTRRLLCRILPARRPRAASAMTSSRANASLARSVRSPRRVASRRASPACRLCLPARSTGSAPAPMHSGDARLRTRGLVRFRALRRTAAPSRGRSSALARNGQRRERWLRRAHRSRRALRDGVRRREGSVGESMRDERGREDRSTGGARRALPEHRASARRSRRARAGSQGDFIPGMPFWTAPVHGFCCESAESILDSVVEAVSVSVEPSASSMRR